MQAHMGAFSRLRMRKHALSNRFTLRPFSTSQTILRSVKSSNRKPKDIIEDINVYKPSNNNKLWRDVKQLQERGGILAWKKENLVMGKETREKLAEQTRVPLKLHDGIHQLMRSFDEELELEKDIDLLGNPESLRYKLKEAELGIQLEHTKSAQQDMDEAADDLGTELLEQAGTSASDLALFDAEFQEGTTSERRIEPGDLVELRTQTMRSHTNGVVIKSKTEPTGVYYFVLNHHGALIKAEESSIHYALEKRFIGRGAMEPVLDWMESVGDVVNGTAKESCRVPEQHSLILCGRVRDYNVQMAADFKKITKSAKPLFLKYARYGKYVKVSFKDAAKIVYGHMSGYPGTMGAVRSLILQNPLLFRSESAAHRFASSFYVRPTDEVELLETLPSKLRLIQFETRRRAGVAVDVRNENTVLVNPFERFIKKCATLIDRSREIKKGFGNNKHALQPLVYVRDSFEEEFELDLLRLFRASFNFGAYQKNIAFQLVPWIIRATERYDDVDQITLNTLRKFLIEIGIDSPWESPVKSLGLLTGIENENNEAKLKEYDDEIRADPEHSLEKFQLSDSMKDLRKDWGHLPVYAIDSVSTVDVDDGISLEEVDENKAWIHVHVANPTAFIPVGHELASIAQMNFSKVYLPEKHIDMLPRFMNYTYFGLGPNRPAMTFSGLFDRNTGKLLETNITNSYVHNVKRIPYDVINERLKLRAREKDGEIFVFGKIKPSKKSTDPATYLEGAKDDNPIILEPSEEDLENLRKLEKLTKVINKRRAKDGAVMVRVSRPQVTVDDGLNGQVIGKRAAPPNVPVLYNGVPNVQLVKPLLGATHSAEDIVAECMVQSGNIASQFLAKLMVPAPYRASLSSTLEENPRVERTWQSILDMRDPEGFLPPEAMKHPNWRHLAPATLTDKARPHRLMGLPSYLQVTSPLRRYADFLTHYQLEYMLRLRTTRPRATAESKNVELPFAEKQVQTIIQNMLDSMTRFKYLQVINDSYWRLQAILTAVWTKDERVIGQKMQARVLRQSISALQELDIELVDWKVRATMTAPKDIILTFEEGDIIEGMISPEDCDYMRVVVNYERTLSKGKQAVEAEVAV